MVTSRLCAFRKSNDEPCHSPPLKDGEYCSMHSPEHVKEVQEARRLGGLRRKRESTISSAYQFESLDSVDGIRRIVLIAVLDALSMENSMSRARTLAYLAQVALRMLEVGEIEERVAALEELARVKK
jgi:hypothetical protein